MAVAAVVILGTSNLFAWVDYGAGCSVTTEARVASTCNATKNDRGDTTRGILVAGVHAPEIFVDTRANIDRIAAHTITLEASIAYTVLSGCVSVVVDAIGVFVAAQGNMLVLFTEETAVLQHAKLDGAAFAEEQ